MNLKQFEVPGLAHYSYLLGSKGQAVVIDPKRDCDTYLNYASENQLQITHVLETHIHADYESGALQLAKMTGAELWLSAHDKGGEYEYRFDITNLEMVRSSKSAISGSWQLTRRVTPRST